MATLEKIRNKSVLLFIIIIVALLAFILGDFLTSGRSFFGNQTTVAQAGDVKVEYQEYQNRISQTSDEMRNQRNQREYTNDEISSYVLQGLISEKLLNKEYADLGINVSDEELTEALTGAYPHQAAMQTIYQLSQQLGLPEASGRVVFDAVQNPAKYNLPAEAGQSLQAVWANLENETANAMMQQKFASLLSGLYTYNKLDAKAMYDDINTVHNIAYVSKDIASVADADVEVADADVEALWKSEKESYRLDEPTTEIDYIYVAIEPSQADRLAAQQAVETALACLNATEGTEAVASDVKFVTSTYTLPASAFVSNENLASISGRLRKFVEENEVGTATLLNTASNVNNNTYKLAKLIGKTMEADSVNFSIVNAAPGVDFDSIATLINAGTSFSALTGDDIAARDSIRAVLYAPNLDAKMHEALATSPVGKAVVLTDTIQGQAYSAVLRVNKRNAAVPYYNLAVVEYTVDPSQETLTDLSSNLRTFISSNSSADEFSKNAEQAGYPLRHAQVGPSSVGLPDARESRRFVKWAIENKAGKVSPVLQDDRQTYLLAIAVKDVYDEYLPWTSPAINTALVNRARDNKKAAKLMEQYSGKANDLKGYAEVLGDSISRGSVNITNPILLSVGYGEDALKGKIAATEKGQFAGPVQGNHGILVYEVEEVSTEGRPFNEPESGASFNQSFGIFRQGPLPLLLGSTKVENHSLNFVSTVGEE